MRTRILPKNVANTTTSILESVIKVGTAKVAGLGKVRAWGKTGTTENYGDAWFVGATDKYTVAVWVGYPGGAKPMRTEYRGEPVAGGTYPAQIWHDFMVSVIQGEQDRIKRQCQREADKREKDGKEDAPPSKKCIDAGLAVDPTAPVPETTHDARADDDHAGRRGRDRPGDRRRPAGRRRRGRDRRGGAGTQSAAGTGRAAPPPDAPPTPVTPPAAPVDPAAPSGGVTPQP